MGYRCVHTLVLPDPWLTQEGPVTFPACALYQLFVRSCDLAHHGLCCSRVCAYTHHSSLQHLSLVFSFVIFSSQTEKQQNVRPPLGTTEWNHSYYTGNSLSALHSLQQSQAGASPPSPVQMSASTRVSHGAAPSSSVSCPQVTLSATHPQVQTGPTSTITSDLLSATLAEAATQLSFAHSWSVASLLMLHRRSRYQSPLHLWMPLRRLFHTPLPLGTFLHNSRSGSSWLHLLRTMFAAPRVPGPSLRHFLTRLCRRLCTASHLTMPPHNYRSRSSSSDVSSPTTLETAKLCRRHSAMLAAPHRLNLQTLLRFAAPPPPAMLATLTSTLRPPRVSPQPPRLSRSMPVNMLHMVYLSKRHRCHLACVHPPQSRPHSHMSVPPKWDHI